MMGAAKRYLLDSVDRSDDREENADDVPPRLTPRAIHQTRMSRSRDRILANLDEMYREAFDRAKATGDAAQMATLDFASGANNCTSRFCWTSVTRSSVGDSCTASSALPR